MLLGAPATQGRATSSSRLRDAPTHLEGEALASDPVLGPLIAFLKQQVHESCRELLERTHPTGPPEATHARMERMEGQLATIQASLSSIHRHLVTLCRMQARTVALLEGAGLLGACLLVALGASWLPALLLSRAG